MTGPVRAPTVVFASEEVVAVDKPSGMLTVPGRRGADDPRPCLVPEVARRFPGTVLVVHRLDVEVSGLVLLARTAGAQRALSTALERREIGKVYEAWTEGAPPGGPGATFTWASRLVRGKRRVFEAPHGKPSRTVAVFQGTLDWRGERLLRFELRPETGRTHQLRHHLAAHGHPVAGDARYGSRVAFLPGAIALRATRLDFARGGAALAALGLPAALEVAPGDDCWRG